MALASIETPRVGCRAWGSVRALLCSSALLCACLAPVSASAGLDLAAASVERLDNGLTVIVLEEPAFPLVSVQMLYRVGAKHEPLGASGLAHFLEHMAFRSSENFPGTQLVSSIYAAGGEWHGYTWLDQTTYFATVPRQELDLLLRIEADRMTRLLIPEADIAAERGAVLAEMHGYENDPASVLHDNVLYVSFLAHPYRNKTIGWESDVAGIRHEELVGFYRRHYQPGNAVLAVVGDVRTADVRSRVAALFGSFEGRPATPEPRTVEPQQQGERRIRLAGPADRKHFKIAWRAPSVHSPDFAAFLVLQELLAGGSGVSFLQDDWGTPARPDSPLGAAAADIATWFPPSAQDYVFTVSGSLPADGDEAELEAAVQQAIVGLEKSLAAEGPGPEQALREARRAVSRDLLFDVQTTEDAAHQLAFFAGMDALELLTGLPPAVDAVRPGDVQRAIQDYLGAEKRTVGWSVPPAGPAAGDGAAVQPESPALPADPTRPASQAVAGRDGRPSSAPVSSAPQGATVAAATTVGHLRNGTPVIIRHSPLSPTVLLKAVLPGQVVFAGADSRPNEPSWGETSIDVQVLSREWESAVAGLRSALDEEIPEPAGSLSAGDDPGERLERHFRDILGLGAEPPGPAARPSPLLFVVSGDIEPQRARETLDGVFGELPPPSIAASTPLNDTGRMEIESAFERPVALEQLGYVVRAPGPRDPNAAAWWMALYVLSHGYEGRLGTEAISRRGLVYYIDSAYRSNGRDGWITLSTGVDPAKWPAMRDLLRSELDRLLREPPTPAEVDEARRHLLGRFLSAAQSNPELADRLATDWSWYGEVVDYDTLAERLGQVTREDLLALLPAMTAGTIVSVRNPSP